MTAHCQILLPLKDEKAPDELRHSWSGGVSTVLLRNDCESELAEPLAGPQQAR
jgi:hypothetical protein